MDSNPRSKGKDVYFEFGGGRSFPSIGQGLIMRKGTVNC